MLGLPIFVDYQRSCLYFGCSMPLASVVLDTTVASCIPRGFISQADADQIAVRPGGVESVTAVPPLHRLTYSVGGDIGGRPLCGKAPLGADERGAIECR